MVREFSRYPISAVIRAMTGVNVLVSMLTYSEDPSSNPADVHISVLKGTQKVEG